MRLMPHKGSFEATKAKAEAEKLIKIKEAEGQKESMKLSW